MEAGRLEKTAKERKERLDATLMEYGARGWRIENRSDFQATIAKGKHVSHGVHIFLSIITIGAWLLIYALFAMFGGVKRRIVSIDQYGNAIEQKISSWFG